MVIGNVRGDSDGFPIQGLNNFGKRNPLLSINPHELQNSNSVASGAMQWHGLAMELKNALSISCDAFLRTKHIAYSTTAASQGSVIRPQLSPPAKPNSSWDIGRSSRKTAVPSAPPQTDQPGSIPVFLQALTRPRVPSLLGTPVPLSDDPQIPPTAHRRSGRLDQKNRNNTTAKRAELKLMEVFGDLPAKADCETETAVAAAKMKAYLQLFKEPLTLKVIEAIRVLTGVRGKSQIDLKALGFTAAELAALGQEVPAQ